MQIAAEYDADLVVCIVDDEKEVCASLSELLLSEGMTVI